MNEVQKKPRGCSIFSKHPFWLGRYHLLNILIYSIATVLVLYWKPLFGTISLWWLLSLIPLFLSSFCVVLGCSILLGIMSLIYYWTEISLIHLVLLPAAIYIGHLSSMSYHNAVHNNFKPNWLNPVIGEICALQQLSIGFPAFQFIHNEHHSHPDDLKRDPHPPRGYTFLAFIDVSRSLIMNRLTAIYLEKWGESKQSIRAWKIQNYLILCSRFVKTFFLFALFGPKIFTLLYLPSYLSSVFLFAAINYFTHVEKEDGTIEILNLDHHWYYKICNAIFFGVMYHKNHHLRPKLFNPRDMKPNIVK